MKERVLFCGTSNTIGLGLDLELGERYNDIVWLKKNGLHPPFNRLDIDNEIIEKYRWPTLVSNYFDFNQNDNTNTKFDLGRVTKTLEKLIDMSPMETEDIKHVFLESAHIFRLYLPDGTQITPNEMVRLLNDPNTDSNIVHNIHSFLDIFDETSVYKSFIEMFCKARDIHPHIHFHLLVWFGIPDIIMNTILESVKDNIVSITINGETSTNIHNILTKNKLRVCDTAFGYSNNIDEMGNKLWDVGEYVDMHANKLGNELIAQNIIERIKKL
jgi:hypothetical protein